MRRLVTALAVVTVVAFGWGCGERQPSPEETTLVDVGDVAPTFAAETLDGGTFDLEAQRGSVVVLSFFATWCPPCREEAPHLERLWERLGDRQDFSMVAVAREEGPDVLEPFVETMGITYPIAPDPDRAVYARYADMYIPRTLVIGRDGTVLVHEKEFSPGGFEALVGVVERELAQRP